MTAVDHRRIQMPPQRLRRTGRPRAYEPGDAAAARPEC
jgi:hypothetical protein